MVLDEAIQRENSLPFRFSTFLWIQKVLSRNLNKIINYKTLRLCRNDLGICIISARKCYEFISPQKKNPTNEIIAFTLAKEKQIAGFGRSSQSLLPRQLIWLANQWAGLESSSGNPGEYSKWEDATLIPSVKRSFQKEKINFICCVSFPKNCFTGVLWFKKKSCPYPTLDNSQGEDPWVMNWLPAMRETMTGRESLHRPIKAPLVYTIQNTFGNYQWGSVRQSPPKSWVRRK